MISRIYLDNNATTALDPRVAKAMLEVLSASPSNPSSVHQFGQEAKRTLLRARETIAHYLRCEPHEIIFTSGGTESMNLLIHSILFPLHKPWPRNGHIITSTIEHACIYHTLKAYAHQIPISFLSPGLVGALSPTEIAKAITPETEAIIISAVNGETGVKSDLEGIATLAEHHNIALIVDGVALLGKEPFSIPKGVSAMGFSGHKLHAPQGTGFVFARTSFPITPLLRGGDQEGGRRAGTENLAGYFGLSTAISLLNEELPLATERMMRLRDFLEEELIKGIPNITINGQGPRIANISNLSFPKAHGEDLLIALDLAGIAVSHGSACASGALEPSRVLLQMGILPELARSALRFSLSRNTTEEEIRHCINTIKKLLSYTN